MRVLYHLSDAWSTRAVSLPVGSFSQWGKPFRYLSQLLIAKPIPIECYGFFNLHHHDGEGVGRSRRLGRRCEEAFRVSGPNAKFSDKWQFAHHSVKTRECIVLWFVICACPTRFDALKDEVN